MKRRLAGQLTKIRCKWLQWISLRLSFSHCSHQKWQSRFRIPKKKQKRKKKSCLFHANIGKKKVAVIFCCCNFQCFVPKLLLFVYQIVSNHTEKAETTLNIFFLFLCFQCFAFINLVCVGLSKLDFVTINKNNVIINKVTTKTKSTDIYRWKKVNTNQSQLNS